MKKTLFIAALLFTNIFAIANEFTDFIKSVEGTVMRDDIHIVYDDANPKVRWNGKETFEEFKKRCSGKPTIGYGFTSKKLVEKCFLTKEEADIELERIVKLCENRICKSVKVNLNNNQKTALISFIYNIGGKNFSESTLVKKLNQNDFIGASNEFERWKYTRKNGKLVFSKGLLNRRKLEKAKFLCK